MVCYLIPIFGALLADSYLGRFRTILFFSGIYAVGDFIMCFGATSLFKTSKIKITFIDLILIAIGTGGIKPCVAAFGGDQFYLPQQQKYLQDI
ncbi:hypothetical protein HCN44_007742 [Aphidius gifuensis]|uniref:Uncharacterized protein n=1 Tax=Aphidius gifuensis TaxID=684658 RepID=A0A834XPF1_APHGI|nr:hypothetical protein HCN44_007742 [Aphidius gifuensis]